MLTITPLRNFSGLTEFPKVATVTKEYEKERTNMKKLLLGIGVFGLALGVGVMGISYASEAPQADSGGPWGASGGPGDGSGI